jgi:hypothetical protein
MYNIECINWLYLIAISPNVNNFQSAIKNHCRVFCLQLAIRTHKDCNTQNYNLPVVVYGLAT